MARKRGSNCKGVVVQLGYAVVETPSSGLEVRESIDRLGGVVLRSLEGSVRLLLS